MAGDRGAPFDEFVLRESPRLMRTALLLTGDRAAAEDLLQDVLERLYVVWPRVQEPMAYARRSLAHGATSRWRQRGRRREVALDASHDRQVGDAATDAVERDRVLRALAQLPARQRAVVVLRYYEDLSEAQTAEAMGCSRGTVKSQASRALSRLRELLGDERVPGGTA